MTRELAAVLVLVVLAVLLTLMLVSWRRRVRRSGALPAAAVPADRGAPLHIADVLYVATTAGGQPLERIAADGLGFRARAGVEVSSAGVLLRIAGAADRWIPAADLRGADRATWTIDRVVERDGLVLLAWTAPSGSGGGRELDSYLRTDEPAALIAALDVIIPVPSPAPKGTA